ncbi:SDR family oxidoreductase [Terriglobus sp. ADX1]|uniref:SDR family oxidoreductase n=1 Tax=Terriglobus sp. ADX1 TaxID=2794063 RepID=UPI003FCC36BA
MRALRCWTTLRTKAAILAFTRALARQVAQDGIRVNCVALGPVWRRFRSVVVNPRRKFQSVERRHR